MSGSHIYGEPRNQESHLFSASQKQAYDLMALLNIFFNSGMARREEEKEDQMLF